MMAEDPDQFKVHVQESCVPYTPLPSTGAPSAAPLLRLRQRLPAGPRAGADIMAEDGEAFRYPSYVDIMGPMCFDYGGPFGGFVPGNPADLDTTDAIACEVLRRDGRIPAEIAANGGQHPMDPRPRPTSSSARASSADAEGRMRIASLQRRHRRWPTFPTRRAGRTTTMSAERTARTGRPQHLRWLRIHHRHGRPEFRRRRFPWRHVGVPTQRRWRRLRRGDECGFDMLIDGSPAAEARLTSMLRWDVNNGIARRSWARNLKRNSPSTAPWSEPRLKVTLAQNADPTSSAAPSPDGTFPVRLDPGVHWRRAACWPLGGTPLRCVYGLDLTGFDLRNTRRELHLSMHLGGREDDRRPLARGSVRTLYTACLRWSTRTPSSSTSPWIAGPDGDWEKWTAGHPIQGHRPERRQLLRQRRPQDGAGPVACAMCV